MKERRLISITESNTWLSCRVRHDYRYRQLLTPLEEREPLVLGKATHIGLETYYQTADTDGAVLAALEYLEARPLGKELKPLVEGMLRHYVTHWRGQESFEVLHVELPFRVPLISPSGRISRVHDLVGRVDMVVKKPDGSVWLVEHKTLGNKDRDYFRKLDTDFQVRAYCWAVSRYLGVPIKGVIYNVLRTKLPVEPEVLKNGSISKRANIDTTLAVFEAALKKAGSNPADYAEILERLRQEGNTFFLREERELPPDDLKRWALEMYAITREMRLAQALYRNPTACSLWGGCEYRDLCAGLLGPEEIKEKFRTLTTRYPELADVDLAQLKPAPLVQQEPGRVSDEFLQTLLFE